MSDRGWRELERAWEAAPGDQGVLARLIAARRRAGVSVGGELLDARRFAERWFNSGHELRVDVEHADGRREMLGVTPAPGEGIRVPAYRNWSVHGRPASNEDARSLCRSLAAQGLHGLVFDAEPLDGDGIRHLGLLGGGSGAPVGSRAAEAGAPGAQREPLESLALLGLRHVNDVDLAETLQALPGLLRLTLAGFSDRQGLLTVRALAGLKRLVRLGVHGCRALPQLLEPLRGHLNLERLEVVDAPSLTSHDLAFVSSLALRKLALSGCDRVDTPGLLEHLPSSLRTLNLWIRAGGDVDDAVIERLAERLPELRRLRLPSDSAVGARALEALGRLPLESLGLDGDGLGESALGSLPASLQTLTLWSQRLGGEGISQLARLSNLEDLTLFAMELDPFEAQAFSGLPLKKLALRCFEWEVEAHLADDVAGELPSTLEELSVRVPWTGAALRHLAGYPALRRLDVMRCPQLDDLSALAELPALRELELSFCDRIRDLPPELPLELLAIRYCEGLGDDAVRVLPSYPNLRELHLVGRGFSAELLPILSALRGLRVLYVHSEEFPAAAAARLREALPDCWIVR